MQRRISSFVEGNGYHMMWNFLVRCWHRLVIFSRFPFFFPVYVLNYQKQVEVEKGAFHAIEKVAILETSNMLLVFFLYVSYIKLVMKSRIMMLLRQVLFMIGRRADLFGISITPRFDLVKEKKWHIWTSNLILIDNYSSTSL